MVLAQYDYTIMHIPGERSHWGDLLSRWVNVATVAVRAVVVFVSSAPDEIMLSKDAISEVQQQAKAGLGAMVSGASSFITSSFTTPVSRATNSDEYLFCAVLDSRDVLWIPEQSKEMHRRLMVCAHMKDAEHRRVVATLQWLQGFCCWFA